jgi:hypothetical protein
LKKSTWALLILFCLMLWCAVAQDAKAATNLQVCTAPPISQAVGSVAGCPTGSFLFSPVLPTTLVRSQVNNTQGWRAFSSLHAMDQVYAADGQWHVLGSLVVARSAPDPPSGSPPVTTPPTTSLTQSVTVTVVGVAAPQAVQFNGMPIPVCLLVSTGFAPPKQVCLP